MKKSKKHLEEYKKAIELKKDKQLSDVKKYCKAPKKVTTVVKENNKLKIYIENIKQRYQQYQKQPEEDYFNREREYVRAKTTQKL